MSRLIRKSESERGVLNLSSAAASAPCIMVDEDIQNEQQSTARGSRLIEVRAPYPTVVRREGLAVPHRPVSKAWPPVSRIRMDTYSHSLETLGVFHRLDPPKYLMYQNFGLLAHAPKPGGRSRTLAGISHLSADNPERCRTIRNKRLAPCSPVRLMVRCRGHKGAAWRAKEVTPTIWCAVANRCSFVF